MSVRDDFEADSKLMDEDELYRKYTLIDCPRCGKVIIMLHKTYFDCEHIKLATPLCHECYIESKKLYDSIPNTIYGNKPCNFYYCDAEATESESKN